MPKTIVLQICLKLATRPKRPVIISYRGGGGGHLGGGTKVLLLIARGDEHNAHLRDEVKKIG